MPLPLLFIGIAAASGMFVIGGTVKAGFDAKNAKQINKSANELVQESTDYLNAQRLACGNSLTRLGAEKMAVLNGTISDFLNVLHKLKMWISKRRKDWMNSIGFILTSRNL